MPLITDSVKKNAAKCAECAFVKMRKGIDKHGVMSEEADVAVHGIMNVSCKLCPNGEDFKKMYGSYPYEYFV